MSIEKQKLYNEIETLPEELTNQVINFIEYLKVSYIDTEAPDSITIKSKKVPTGTCQEPAIYGWQDTVTYSEIWGFIEGRDDEKA